MLGAVQSVGEVKAMDKFSNLKVVVSKFPEKFSSTHVIVVHEPETEEYMRVPSVQYVHSC